VVRGGRSGGRPRRNGSALRPDGSVITEHTIAAIRILIVDDHEVVRAGLVHTFSADPGYSIVGAVANARDALRRARQTLPDVVLIDLRLPDMSGTDLCRELRVRFPSTAVIIFTAYLSEETVRAAIQAGAGAYVTKAAGLDELRSALERVGGRPQSVEIGDGPQIVRSSTSSSRRA
jgi:DNA-binding NarL/FixJ family response regulator